MRRAVGRLAVSVLSTLIVSAGAARADDWPRFRGPNGQGVAADGAKPPAEFGAGKNLAWAAELPPGHSSPVVSGGRVFLTCYDGKALETVCLDAATGKVLWRKAAPAKTIE